MSRERYESDAHSGDGSSDVVEYVLVDDGPFTAYLGLFVRTQQNTVAKNLTCSSQKGDLPWNVSSDKPSGPQWIIHQCQANAFASTMTFLGNDIP